jgi:hypothetical protein
MAFKVSLVTNNLVLKIISLIFGFLLWYIIGQAFTTTMWLTVPVCIDDAPDNFIIESADIIKIHVAGKRADLRNLNLTSLAFHVDAQKLVAGTNRLAITAEKLFLPESIKLLNYSPLVFSAQATRTITKDTISCTA